MVSELVSTILKIVILGVCVLFAWPYVQPVFEPYIRQLLGKKKKRHIDLTKDEQEKLRKKIEEKKTKLKEKIIEKRSTDFARSELGLPPVEEQGKPAQRKELPHEKLQKFREGLNEEVEAFKEGLRDIGSGLGGGE